MKKLLLMATAALLCWTLPAAAQTAEQENVIVYGEAFESASAMSAGRLPVLLKNKDELKDVGIVGYVTEVCQKEGCWLKLAIGDAAGTEVMVKMKDHAFMVPKDLAGQRVLVHGTVTKKAVSVAEQKHYLEDAGASQEEIDQITAPKEGYVMVVDGVKVARQ